MTRRGNAASPIALIEAGYSAQRTESAWLEGLVEASAGYDLGPGVLAYTVEIGKKPTIATMCTSGDAALAIEPLEALVAQLSPRTAGALFAPTEFVGNAAWRMKRIADARPGAAADLADGSQIPPLWGIVGGDGKTRAIALTFMGKKKGFAADLAFPHADRRILGLVAAHLTSALRLRACLPANVDDETTEAILDSRGRVLHAAGKGRTATARRSLSEAVVCAERARGNLRKTDAEGAADLWRALVDGRWSIVESTERDGKRLLLARANPPSAADLTALTKTESTVVWLAAFGHSYKFIAYELGITMSAVVRRLRSAMLKLGVATRQELLRKLGR